MSEMKSVPLRLRAIYDLVPRAAAGSQARRTLPFALLPLSLRDGKKWKGIHLHFFCVGDCALRALREPSNAQTWLRLTDFNVALADERRLSWITPWSNAALASTRFNGSGNLTPSFDRVRYFGRSGE